MSKKQLGWKAFVDLAGPKGGFIEEERVFSSRVKAERFAFTKLPREFRTGNPRQAIRKFLAHERSLNEFDATIKIEKLMDGQRTL